MGARGNIYYLSTEPSFQEVESDFGFPVLLFITNGNGKIIKHIAYSTSGFKSEVYYVHHQDLETIVSLLNENDQHNQTLGNQLTGEISDLNEKLGTLQTEVNELPIGQVSDAALFAIRQQKNLVRNEYTDLTSRYDVIYNDVFLTDKIALGNAYGTASSGYLKAYNDLFSYLDNAFSDADITQVEKDTLQSLIDVYRGALEVLSLQLQLALKAIEQEKIDALWDDLNDEIIEVRLEVGDVDSRITTLQGTYDEFASDGAFTIAEAKALEKYLNSLNTEKEDLEAKFDVIYVNSFLDGIPKTNLALSYSNYAASHLTLINTITDAITDGKSDASEKQLVDNAFADYRTKLGLLSGAFEMALNYITTAKANDVSDKVFDGTGYFDANKIKPVSIEAKHIALGDRMQRFTLPGITFYLEDDYTSLRYTSGSIVHQTIDITPKTWTIAANKITGITTVFQYVYIKADRDGTTATVLVTPAQIKVEQDPDYFHFEAGYISALQNGFRTVKTTFGFAQINPAELSIGRISSPIGDNYIDLKSDGIDIVGRVTFKAGSSGYNNLSDKPDLTPFQEAKNYIDNTLPQDLAALQSQIDGNMTSWFFGYEPTTANAPASNWTTTEQKNTHLGDLFYNTVTGYAYRYQLVGGVYSWQRITDTDVTKALADASKAQDTADSKRRVFVVQPTTPYDVGDLWAQGPSGVIMRAVVSRATGSYVAADWQKADKYTDDSALNSFVSTTYLTDKNSLQGQIDGKIETWFQATNPADNWTTLAEKQSHYGDMWYNSTTKQLRRYAAEGFVLIEDQKAIDAYSAAATAQDTADGKRTVFVAQPTNAQAYQVGDLWVNATVGSYVNEILRAQTAKAAGVAFNLAHWVLASKYTDDSRAILAEQNAKAYADTVKSQVLDESAELNNAVKNLGADFNALPTDVLLSAGQLFGLRAQVELVKGEANDITARYNYVYNDPYLSGTPKTDLLTKYTAFNSAQSDLVFWITDSLSDKKLTSAEKSAIQTRVTTYNNAITQLGTALQTASDAIATNIATGKIDSATVGGENLLSNLPIEWETGSWTESGTAIAYPNFLRYKTEINAKGGVQYTVQNYGSVPVEIAILQAAAGGAYSLAAFKTLANTNKVTFRTADITARFKVRIYTGAANMSPDDIKILKIKLEEGALATGFSTSRNDKDALLQLEVDNVENKANQLENLTSTTLLDNVIDTAEATALGRNIDLLNNEKEDLEKEKVSLEGDPLLIGTPKTNLQTAWTAFNNAHTALNTKISDIVTDKKVTAVTRAQITNLFSAYKSTLGTLSTRLTEAVKAIEAKRLETIQIDPNNLVKNSTFEYGLWHAGYASETITRQAPETDKPRSYITRIQVSNSPTQRKTPLYSSRRTRVTAKAGTPVTLSLDVKSASLALAPKGVIITIRKTSTSISTDYVNVFSPVLSYTNYGSWQRISATGTLPIDINSEWLAFGYYIHADVGDSLDFQIREVKFELSIKETAYTLDLERVTGWIDSDVNGNAMATGTLLVGNPTTGANAGITGVLGADDMFLWGGSSFANRNKAPFAGYKNGVLRFRYPNSEQVGFEIGIINGKLTFNGYNTQGTLITEWNPTRGIVPVTYTPEDYEHVRARKLAYTSATYNQSTLTTEVTNAIVKGDPEFIYFAMPGDPISVETEYVVSTKYTLASNYSCFDYDNGTDPANASYASFKGYKTTSGNRNTNVPNGWYIIGSWPFIPESPTIWDVHNYYRGESDPATMSQFNITVVYIDTGKITQTKVLTITK